MNEKKLLVIPIAVTASAILVFNGCSNKTFAVKKGKSTFNNHSNIHKRVAITKQDEMIAHKTSAPCAVIHHTKPLKFKKRKEDGSQMPDLFSLDSSQPPKLESSSKLHISSAKYIWSTKKILVKEATEIKVPIPATYKTVTYKKLIEPQKVKVIATKPVYKISTKRVMIEPQKFIWVKGSGPIEKIDKNGELVHLVKIAPKYRVTKIRKLIKLGKKRVLKIPAKYEITTKLVIDKPARVKVVTIPAVYKIVKVRTLSSPPIVKEFEIPTSDRVAGYALDKDDLSSLTLNKKAKSVLGL